jgi:hypothetical protein
LIAKLAYTRSLIDILINSRAAAGEHNSNKTLDKKNQQQLQSTDRKGGKVKDLKLKTLADKNIQVEGIFYCAGTINQNIKINI